MNALRVASVAKKLDVGTATVWRLLKKDPSFPKPFKVSEHVAATAWMEHEIDNWLLTRMQTRGAPLFEKEDAQAAHTHA